MLVERDAIATALPDYELGPQIGHGGFGLVFAATHNRLRRTRAVKVIVLTDRELAEASVRFLTEAQIMTELDHPHIVRVFDYTENDALRLLIMEYLPGGTLADRLGGPVDPGTACAWTLAVADALHTAHQQGIIHRDIKPANLLFTEQGLLKVSDFGIAKLIEGTAGTGSLDLLGTPAFLSPEQITGAQITPAADLYALGATLYQLLTGRSLFPAGLPTPALLVHHLDEAPAPLPEAHPALAAVTLRALAKDPADRPASARDFALELADAAAIALGPGWLTRSGVPLRVDRAMLTAAVDSTPAPAPTIRRSARALVDPPAATTRRSARVLLDAPASRLPPPGDDTPTESLARPGDAGPPIRPRRSGSPRRIWLLVTLAVVIVVFSAWIVTAMPWHTTTTAGRTTHTLTGHTGGVTAVAFSPDGSLLATASEDHTVRLWNTTTGKTAHILTAPAGQSPNDPTTPVPAVAFSPDGKTLATSTSDGIALWSTATGRTTRTLRGPAGTVTAVTFNPDGTSLATASDDDTARLWDLTTGKITHTLAGHKAAVLAVAFSSDGSTLATASGDGTARLWDTATGKTTRTFTGHTSGVRGLAFSPDGNPLATASDDGSVRLWDLTTGKIAHVLVGHRGAVFAVAFSPDGRTLAAASADGTARLWSTLTDQPTRTFAGHKGAVFAVAFSPDGETLATASADGTARLWPLG